MFERHRRRKIHEEAVRYAANGWPVAPLAVPHHGVCPCGGNCLDPHLVGEVVRDGYRAAAIWPEQGRTPRAWRHPKQPADAASLRDNAKRVARGEVERDRVKLVPDGVDRQDSAAGVADGPDDRDGVMRGVGGVDGRVGGAELAGGVEGRDGVMRGAGGVDGRAGAAGVAGGVDDRSGVMGGVGGVVGRVGAAELAGGVELVGGGSGEWGIALVTEWFDVMELPAAYGALLNHQLRTACPTAMAPAERRWWFFVAQGSVPREQVVEVGGVLRSGAAEWVPAPGTWLEETGRIRWLVHPYLTEWRPYQRRDPIDQVFL